MERSFIVLRLQDNEATRPLRRNRFFLCEEKDFVNHHDVCPGKVCYWGDTEDYVAKKEELHPLPPDREAAVRYLILNEATTYTTRAERLTLNKTGGYLMHTLFRGLRDLPNDLRKQTQADLRHCKGLDMLYAQMKKPDDLAAKSRLGAFWKEALVQAHDLTRLENEVFDLA